MTSVEEVAGQLRAARELADGAIDQATAARVLVDEAIRQFQAATRGSSRPEAVATGNRWAAAREHLDRMIGRLLAGAHAVDTYAALITGRAGETVAGLGQPDPPAAEQIARAEDRATRRARLRRELLRRGDDVIDATRTTTEALQNLVHVPPPNLPPVAPDVAAGMVAGGIVAAEAAARVGRALRRLKEKHDHHDG